MEKVYPTHPVFNEFQEKLASNQSLANLIGLPEKDPSVDALSKIMQTKNMFAPNSSSDPAAQNTFNPFTGEQIAIKSELPE